MNLVIFLEQFLLGKSILGFPFVLGFKFFFFFYGSYKGVTVLNKCLQLKELSYLRSYLNYRIILCLKIGDRSAWNVLFRYVPGGWNLYKVCWTGLLRLLTHPVSDFLHCALQAWERLAWGFSSWACYFFISIFPGFGRSCVCGTWVSIRWPVYASDNTPALWSPFLSLMKRVGLYNFVFQDLSPKCFSVGK